MKRLVKICPAYNGIVWPVPAAPRARAGAARGQRRAGDAAGRAGPGGAEPGRTRCRGGAGPRQQRRRRGRAGWGGVRGTEGQRDRGTDGQRDGRLPTLPPPRRARGTGSRCPRRCRRPEAEAMVKRWQINSLAERAGGRDTANISLLENKFPDSLKQANKLAGSVFQSSLLSTRLRQITGAGKPVET